MVPVDRSSAIRRIVRIGVISRRMNTVLDSTGCRLASANGLLMK